jgi:hypothetical protein
MSNEQKRPESGPMEFEDDWTGLFIRGDDCMYYSQTLSQVLEALENGEEISALDKIGILSLRELIASAYHHGIDSSRQLLKKFEDSKR